MRIQEKPKSNGRNIDKYQINIRKISDENRNYQMKIRGKNE